MHEGERERGGGEKEKEKEREGEDGGKLPVPFPSPRCPPDPPWLLLAAAGRKVKASIFEFSIS